MRDTPPHLKALEEVEREGIPSLTEVLREEDIDAVKVRPVVRARLAQGLHRSAAWRNRATEEQKRKSGIWR